MTAPTQPTITAADRQLAVQIWQSWAKETPEMHIDAIAAYREQQVAAATAPLREQIADLKVRVAEMQEFIDSLQNR